MEKSVRWGRSRRPSERAPNAERETCCTYRATRSDGRRRVIRTRSAPGHLSPTPRAFCRVDNRFRRTPERPISGTFGIHGFLRWLVFPGACGGCCGGEGAEGARRPSPLATRRGRVTRVSPGCVTAVSLRKIPDLHRRSVDPLRPALNPPPRLISIIPFPDSNHSLFHHGTSI